MTARINFAGDPNEWDRRIQASIERVGSMSNEDFSRYALERESSLKHLAKLALAEDKDNRPAQALLRKIHHFKSE